MPRGVSWLRPVNDRFKPKAAARTTIRLAPPMARSLCEVERLASPKLENFLPYRAVSADLLARTRRPEAARAAHCKALALEPNSAGPSAATSGFTTTRTPALASPIFSLRTTSQRHV